MIEVKVKASGLKLGVLNLKQAAGKLIQDLSDYAEKTLREEAPEKTGALKKSIRKTVSGLEAEIGSHVPYTIYVEYGTRPHVITPVHAHALSFEVGGETVFAKLVHHPGTKPNPFVRRTAEKTTRRIPQVWRNVWEAVISGLLQIV